MRTDLAYLKNMSGDNNTLIAEMIDIFTEQIGEISDDMQMALESQNWENLGRIAHKAKSSVAIMGMTDLAAALKELEINAGHGEKKEMYPSIVARFMIECTEAIEELHNYIIDQQKNQ